MRLLSITIILFTGMIFAQPSVEKFTPQLNAIIDNSNQSEELLVWIFFTDKGNETQNYFQKPSTVVSEKSLERRAKVLSADKLVSETDLPVNHNYIVQVQSLGFVLKQKTKWFNGVSGWIKAYQLPQIAVLPFVKQMDIVYRFRSDKFEEETINEQPEEPNESLSKPTGTNSFNYGQSLTQLNIISVPLVHDLGYTGNGVTICMMDAGFDRLSHQVFSSMNIIAAWDFVNGDPDVQNGSDMGEGSHGTSTLSLIGGFYETKLIGPAFGAEFILAKTENTDSETPIEEDNWIAAMEWADSIGVDITSTSLGYLDYDPPYPSYTWEDMDGNTARITNGADYAVSLGIFVVNSAGNSGFNASHNTLGAPADGDSVIAVGSVTSSGNRSSFSSVGPTVDGRIKPDLMAMGSSNYVACNSSNTCYSSWGSGTSWSCPMVAGAAALLLEADPSLTPMQLASLMKNTASLSNNPNNLMGWGIVNTYSALQSLLTGVNNTNQLPEDFYLLQNYPNPFNPSTKIRFAVPEKSSVKIYLHDILGSEIAVILDEEVNPGIKEIELNGSNLASGVYLVRMVANNYQQTIKISLLK
ncbi:MAG TPA: S8 family serine peptidase [Ignavibacteriaceae bacterium]|nr:S8 family serine peptidase [Ignavibacteriaceae bacterium]